jgi:hypothetical protein
MAVEFWRAQAKPGILKGAILQARSVPRLEALAVLRIVLRRFAGRLRGPLETLGNWAQQAQHRNDR